MPGKWFEDFVAGQVLRHSTRRTVSQKDNEAFCRLTDNRQPLHLDEAYAKRTPFGRIVVNGLLPIAWGVGVSVEDTTEGTLVANLGYEEVRNVAPVFPGDTLRCETRVVEARPSSKPDRGVVTLQHRVLNQSDVEVCSFKRIVLVQRRRAAEAE